MSDEVSKRSRKGSESPKKRGHKEVAAKETPAVPAKRGRGRPKGTTKKRRGAAAKSPAVKGRSGPGRRGRPSKATKKAPSSEEEEDDEEECDE